MDVATALPKVPRANLGRTPRTEFGRVWAAAERALAAGPGDHYLTGVVWTLRWIAGREMQTPVTRAPRWAMPETRDAEYMAAIRAARSTTLHSARVGIAQGTEVVLRWLGHGGPEPTLPHSSTAASS